VIAFDLRAGLRAVWALALTTTSLLGACDPQFGALPARCSEGAEPGCPEGYDCIRGVCAEPGTNVPATVERLQFVRPVDVRLVVHRGDVLAVWQRYDYESELHSFVAARLDPTGEVGPAFVIVSDYPADSDQLEPYFDVASIGERLFVAVGAAPYDDRNEPRLSLFVAAEGEGAPPVTAPVWETRMRTLGYGAVSRPGLLAKGDGARLGYFESEAREDQTGGALALFGLGSEGDRLNPKECAEPGCCLADRCEPARRGSTLAVGVQGVFEDQGRELWVLDDVRPTLLEPLGNGQAAELELPLRSIVAEFVDGVVRTLEPDPEAAGYRVVERGLEGSTQARPLALVPTAEGAPAPAWITRPGQPAVVVAQSTDGRGFTVSTFNTVTGELREETTVNRFAEAPVSALRAVRSDGAIHLLWLDETSEAATLRTLVVAEP
jgi:hypothetical protein